MSSGLVLFILLAYFGILILISYFTSRKSDNETFFTANRTSPWYLVAFGMIGTSLSGVTFISIPGEVGNSNWTYLPVVMGNCIGYVVIALVLLPLFYKLNLVSIYSWLGIRFGEKARLTGSFFFILSQLVGASFRLFLVVGVLQLALFDSLGIPFALTVFITLGLVWIYTFRGGIKTIVWTDTLQTVFMLISVVLTIAVICQELDLNFSTMAGSIRESSYARIFDWDWRSSHNSLKQFLAGIAITVAINGLDQNMMQKSLTCRSLRDCRINMYSFSFLFLLTNVLFLALGALLYICGDANRRTSRKIGRCFCFFIDELFRSNHRFIFLAGHNGSCLLFCRFFPDLFNHFLQYRFFEDRSKGSFAKTPENRSTSDFFAIDVYRSNSFSGIE
ncbi:MAG: sodium:solute symporter [Odoribacter splanchnicus]